MKKRTLTNSIIIAAGIWAVTAQGVTAADRVSSHVDTKNGKTYVIISNPFVELTFEPDRGGRCTQFRFRDTGEQLIGNAAVSGMFIDQWAKYSWPSGLMWLPYQYEIVGDGKTKVGIRLWVTVPAAGGGKGARTPAAAAKIPTSPELIGLVVRKTIWLYPDRDVIVVEQEVENPTSQSRAVALYIQHNLSMGGSPLYDNWYLPSTRGVVVRVQPDHEGGRAIGPDWVLEPTAGWMAVRDRRTDRGMLFAFDYDYVQKLYTCGMTAEWFMDTVPVQPGKSFRTRYVVKPVKGFKNIVHGSAHILADIRPDEVDGKVRVRHELAAVSEHLVDVDVALTVKAWKTKEVLAEKHFAVPRVGFDRVQQQFEFAPKRLADGVVIRAVVKADGWTERYEYYYAGDKAEHELRYNWFATKGGALAGAKGDAYFVKQPRKVKRIDKPDFAKVARPAPDRFRVLVVFGLYTHILNIDDALAGWRHKGRIPATFQLANCPPNGVETFPGTYDELFAFNTVVLSDVNYRALGDIGFEMICDYVEQGGSLLIVGGPYALGNGEFEGTRFLEVLPVRLSGPFDLKWAGKGKSWALKPAKEKHPVLKGVSFAQNPRVFWHHFVTPKKDAEVVLEAGGEPALVLGRYGKGRVAVLTLSPTGAGAKGEVAWWDWDGWFPLVQNIFSWLNR